jgi:outer membrane lipoprotein SlyB
MATHTLDTSPAAPTTRSVPRALWIGGGLLSLVAAAAAGALVMRATAPHTDTLTGNAVAAQPVPATAALAAKTEPRANKAPSADTSAGKHTATPIRTTPAVMCAACGTVESVHAVQQKGEGTGLGAVAGGVLGGVVGHQVGGGNGKTAMTVIGAVGGGLAGHEIEKRARSTTVFDVQVRMEDGSTRTFQRSEALAVGAHVVVEGTKLRLARNNDNKADESPMVRTSAPANGRT